MVVGQDIAVRPEDDAGAHGHAAVQLGQHRHHRRVHPLVDLLGSQLRAVVRLHFQHHALTGGIGGDGDLLGGGGILLPPEVIVIFKGVLRIVRKKDVPDPQSRSDAHRHCQADQKDPQPRPALFPALRRRRGRHPPRQGTAVPLHHLAGHRLPVGLHHLFRSLGHQLLFFLHARLIPWPGRRRTWSRRPRWSH